MRIFLLALFVAVTGGCASTRTYQVLLKNDAPEAITVGFTKDGPVLEDRWASPEVLSNLPSSRMPEHWGVVIPQGRMQGLKIEGKFESDTHAFLRVYAGKPTTDELLAMSHGTGGRLDLLLNRNGDNNFVIEEREGRLYAHLRRYESNR